MGCRVKSYRFRGHEFVRLENEVVRAEIMVSKGCDLTEFVYKKLDMDFMWHAPVGIVDTSHVIPTCASAKGNNLDYYEGGWHECLPGGGPYVEGGLEEGIHGEVALLPWYWTVTCDEPDKVSVTCSVNTIRAPLKVKKTYTMEAGKAGISVEEEVTNCGQEEFPFLWGQHVVFGAPFLEEGCVIQIPAEEFLVPESFPGEYNVLPPGTKGSWPVYIDLVSGNEQELHRIPPDDCPEADLFYFTNLKEGGYSIVNPKKKLGVSLNFDQQVFDCIWYWKVLRGSFGYPWYGRTYQVGLEFWNGTDYAKDKEAGTIKKMKAGEMLSTSYAMEIFNVESEE